MSVDISWSGSNVAIVTLNDPERRNALGGSLPGDFSSAVRSLAGSRALRAVVVAAAGPAFSAGGDLDALESMTRDGNRPGHGGGNADAMRGLYSHFMTLRELPVPTVAAVSGPAVGAGATLPLVCDLRVASTEAKFQYSYVRLGMHPGLAATWFLPRLVGAGRAADLLYTGRSVDAAEAMSIGLIDRLVAPEQAVDAAVELAESIAVAGPLAIAQVKLSLDRSWRSALDEQLEHEVQSQCDDFRSPQPLEGIAAVRERRAPDFGKFATEWE